MPDKVLIVDDDSSVSTLLGKIMKSNGLTYDITSSGESALRIIDTTHYDLILMDINMHGMDGFEVIQKIREKKITTPVIIVSGRNEDFGTLYGLDIGADDFITKPFNPITLGAKVKAMIRRSRNSLTDTDNIISAGPFTYNTTTLVG